ncbi:DNA-methyltransferase [Acinetobacter sp. ABJ_C5_2]|uniref:DNA-methyltransferase n=1 Tax=Acinetobacter sp. ABJ_C5_2 TaxID=3376992 RepID=UPI0037C73B0D
MKQESFEPKGSFFMLNENVQLGLGDCLELMKQLPDDLIDSIVTDPPYGLKFMGKKWDCNVPGVEIWQECFRVLKPGGHLLAFAGTRTQHRMACNIEDAGFEIRDMIAWVYGSGFPKSHDVSKAIDKLAGHIGETDYIAQTENKIYSNRKGKAAGVDRTPGVKLNSKPQSEMAEQWSGWGTALKPALEPITVARKPFKGTVAQNVLEHGTGAINIDGCRVEGNDVLTRECKGIASSTGEAWKRPFHDSAEVQMFGSTNGRWPANLIHDGSDEVLGLFPDNKSSQTKKDDGRYNPKQYADTENGYFGARNSQNSYADNGSAARFFYCAKASKKDRDEDNKHPTVKPTDLMRYLCRLVTPPNGMVLDPFMGSGSTGKAAMLESFKFIGIEREQEYFEIAKERISCVMQSDLQ